MYDILQELKTESLEEDSTSNITDEVQETNFTDCNITSHEKYRISMTLHWIVHRSVSNNVSNAATVWRWMRRENDYVR
jgi:hypothetical protein